MLALRVTAATLLILLSSCRRNEGHDDDPTSSANAVQTSDLVGLYEQAGGGRHVQLCVVRDSSGDNSFGIVSESPGAGSCAGSGSASRHGRVLQLQMAGDEECVIEGQIAGAQVILPGQLPAGCAYYCAPGATLAGNRLQKTGGAREDALRATDLAGDPLCG